MSEPFTGGKGLAKAIEEGRNPNADLDAPEPGETETRAQAALAMRIGGASYTDIARTLEYSSAYRARSAVERVLADTAESTEDRDKQRVLIDRRLSRLLQSVMGKAVNPNDPEHLAYNARALAIVDRQAKLHGVDAPTQTVVYTPDSEKVERYIAEVLALAQKDREDAEADIMDADVVEDDEAEVD